MLCFEKGASYTHCKLHAACEKEFGCFFLFQNGANYTHFFRISTMCQFIHILLDFQKDASYTHFWNLIFSKKTAKKKTIPI